LAKPIFQPQATAIISQHWFTYFLGAVRNLWMHGNKVDSDMIAASKITLTDIALEWLLSIMTARLVPTHVCTIVSLIRTVVALVSVMLLHWRDICRFSAPLSPVPCNHLVL
jgi:hypothetical protein